MSPGAYGYYDQTGQDAQGRQSGDRAHQPIGASQSEQFIALLMMFTAAFKWCRFYLFLKKWKVKYFWNIVSVKASERPAGLANDTCDVCMIPIICTCCRG